MGSTVWGFFATLNRTASDMIDCHYFYVGAEVEQLMSLSRDGRFSKFVIYITKFATIHAKVKNFQRVMQHLALWIRRKTTEIFACFWNSVFLRKIWTRSFCVSYLLMSNMQGQFNEETVSRYFTLLNYCGKRLTVSKKSPCLDKLVQFFGRCCRNHILW